MSEQQQPTPPQPASTPREPLILNRPRLDKVTKSKDPKGTERR